MPLILYQEQLNMHNNVRIHTACMCACVCVLRECIRPPLAYTYGLVLLL